MTAWNKKAAASMRFKQKLYGLGIALLITFIILHAVTIRVQAKTVLIGHISEQNASVSYSLSANQGDLLTITMSRVSGDLIPSFSLIKPDGKTLLIGVSPVATISATASTTVSAAATSDANSTNLDNAQRTMTQTFQMKDSGIYQLQATYAAQTPATYGDFIITVDGSTSQDASDLARGIPLPVLDIPAVVVANPADPAVTWTGFVTNNAFRLNYLVYLDSLNTFSGSMLRTDGDLEPMLVITNLSGDKVLARGKINNGNAATLTFNPAQSGWYVLVATRTDIDQGKTQGHFTLQMALKAVQ